MKRAFIIEKNQLQEKLSGYVYMMYYRYMNLCVKAEIGALIPIEIVIEGQLKKIEDLAKVAQKDEYSFLVFPEFDEDFTPIMEAVAQSHPEFKQEIETVKVKVDEKQGETEVRFIKLTMPVVDKERRDVLKEATDYFYNECKVSMEAAKAQSAPNFASLMAGEEPKVAEMMEGGVEEVFDTWSKHRDKLHDDKLKEIEDAYAKYVQEQTDREQAAREEKEALGEDRLTSMNLLQAEGE